MKNQKTYLIKLSKIKKCLVSLQRLLIKISVSKYIYTYIYYLKHRKVGRYEIRFVFNRQIIIDDLKCSIPLRIESSIFLNRINLNDHIYTDIVTNFKIL